MKMIYISDTSQPVVVSLEVAEKLLETGKFKSYPDIVGKREKKLTDEQLASYLKKKRKGRPKKEA